MLPKILGIKLNIARRVTAATAKLSVVSDAETPKKSACQAPPPLGFSRQEHWSGLPFISPMHESEKWKWNQSVMSDSYRPHGLQPTRPHCPWDFPVRNTGVGCHCLLWEESAVPHKRNLALLAYEHVQSIVFSVYKGGRNTRFHMLERDQNGMIRK